MDFSKKAQSFCECSRSGRKDRSYSPKRRRKRKGKVVNASLVAVEEDPMAIGAMNTLLDENWEAAPAGPVARGRAESILRKAVARNTIPTEEGERAQKEANLIKYIYYI